MLRSRSIALVVVLGVALVGVPTAAVASGATGSTRPDRAPSAPRNLQVNDAPSPVGVVGAPSFGWQVRDRDPNEAQTAYEVVVASTPTRDPAATSVVWDSGKVASAEQIHAAYAGPVLRADARWYWTVRTWDAAGEGGPFAPPRRFDTGLDDVDWQAQWIRRGSFTASTATPEDYAYLRKEQALGASPITRAVAYVSASHQYQLWVNGTQVDYGPSFSYPDAEYYQSTDITKALHAGALNVFGLLTHWYGSGQGRPAAEPGAIAEISITHEDGTHELVTTDGTWRTRTAPWLAGSKLRNDEGDRIERIDARQAALGWDRPGFDDSAWEQATVIGSHPTAPFTHLVSQRPRVVEHPITPVSLRRLRSGAYVADFGRVYAAEPTVRFMSGRSGRTVRLHVGYLLDPNGQVSTRLGTQATDLSYRYIQRAGPQTFVPYTYLGFRYLQIDDPGEVLHPADVVALTHHTSVPDEHAATFASSNPELAKVWELARHSALYGSQEQFVDTPTREKGQFIGDAAYESFTDQRAFGERNLTRQALLEFLRSQARYWPDGRVNAAEPTGEGARDIPDGTAAFPGWLWQAYLETGDRTLLEAGYPVLVNLADYLAHYIDPATGLVTKLEGGGTDYHYGIVDYPFNMRFGYDMDTTARTTINILAVDAFRRVAAVAGALGRPAAEVDHQQRRASALSAAINQRLRRRDGIYIDGLKATGAPSTHASEHANAYALSYGVAPPRGPERSRVARYVASLGMQMGPGTIYDLLHGLATGGRDAALVKLISDPKQLGWAQILAKGGTFVWETWEPSDALGDSMSHARGAVVLVAMQQALLGVQVRDPGWSTFDVRPPTAGLSQASGRVPTPQGPVNVAWTRGSGGAVTVRLSVPVNAHAVVHVPGRQPVVVGSGSHVVRSR